MARGRIFVSIASYRDAELSRTIRDLVDLAARPQDLTIAVLDQADIPFRRPRSLRGAKLIVNHCPPAESKGACWARAQVQRHFDGEDYYLQLDSHHVVVANWDRILRTEWKACGSDRAVLSAYLPPYAIHRKKPRPIPAVSAAMQVSHFDQDGVILYSGHYAAKRLAAKPFPARFLSGHFLFARGEFVEQVPYDPDLYFFGEESTLAARAFTNGYDLFHPSRKIAWHHYGREGRPRHWNGTMPAENWQDLQRRSVEKYRRIFCLLPHIAPKDGLGTKRTLEDYERWAGINHYWQIIHPATAAYSPPSPDISKNWEVEHRFLHEAHLRVNLPFVPALRSGKVASVYLAIVDATTRDAAARWVSVQQYEALREMGWNVGIRFRSAPIRLIVWPYSPDEGWGKRLDIPLPLPWATSPHSAFRIPPKTPSPPARARPVRSLKNQAA